MVASLVAEPGLQSVWASVVVAHGHVTLKHEGISWTRDRTHVPCIGRQIPITRKVQQGVSEVTVAGSRELWQDKFQGAGQGGTRRW